MGGRRLCAAVGGSPSGPFGRGSADSPAICSAPTCGRQTPGVKPRLAGPAVGVYGYEALKNRLAL
jgi:hypothetical protein